MSGQISRSFYSTMHVLTYLAHILRDGVSDQATHEDRCEGATKMKRKSLQRSVCAVARALDVIGDWWSLLTIYKAIAGPKRFGELERTWVSRKISSRHGSRRFSGGNRPPAADKAALLSYRSKHSKSRLCFSDSVRACLQRHASLRSSHHVR